MRSAEDYLEMAERALDRLEREGDSEKRKALLQVARDWLGHALAEMESLGIEDLRPRAETLSARLDS